MTIYINTNQNVKIGYEICSLSKRIGAYLIDSLVIIGLTIFMIIVLDIISGNSVYMGMFLFSIPMFFYHLICELTMNGQSIGKRATKIKVIKVDGTQASFSNYFLRFLLRPIDSIYFIGLVTIFFTSKGQRLGDIAAGTVLISTENKQNFDDFKNAHSADESISYPEVDQLSDKDIEVINKILANRKRQPNHENVTLLAQRISELLKVTPKESDAYTFLKKIVKDYNASFSG